MKKIDKISKDVLGLLTNTPSQLICADRVIMQFGSTTLEASEFKIKLDEESYLCLSSNWYECQETCLDYPVLSAKKCSFQVLSSTSIFSFENKGVYEPPMLLSVAHDDDSSLVYEGGVLLSRDDGKKVIIYGGDSAFRNLVLEHGIEQVDNYLNKVVSLQKI